MSTHYVVMTLQPIFLATSRGTFLYTPIFWENSISSFLACTANSQFSGFQSSTSSQNSMSLHHSPALNLCTFVMRTLICMLHRIGDTRSVNRAAFFRCWSEFQSAENTIQIVSGRTVETPLSKRVWEFLFCRQQLQSSPRVVLVALFLSTILFPFCLRHALFVSTFTIRVRSFFFECLSIDDTILLYQQVFGDFASSCFCFPSSHPPSILLGACVFRTRRHDRA